MRLSFPSFWYMRKKKRGFWQQGCNSNSDYMFISCLTCNERTCWGGDWGEGEKSLKSMLDLGTIVKNENSWFWGHREWKEWGRWQIYSLHVRGEWILRSLWCLPKELLFLVSLNERWGVWRMACSQKWAVKFLLQWLSGLILVGLKRTAHFASSLLIVKYYGGYIYCLHA